MRVELFDRLIQVTVEKDSYFSQKATHFANKYFAHTLRLSNSILVLNREEEQVKREYFLNWAYHIGVHRDTDTTRKIYQNLLENKHLPIRIKYTDSKGTVEYVEVGMKFINAERIALTLNKQNRLARRFLISTFRDHMVGYTKKELFLDNTRASFWEKLMNSLRQRTFHNVSIHFEYDKWKIQDMMLGSPKFKSVHNAKYLTKEEKRLRKSYDVLRCDMNDSFDEIKNRYLGLVKEYHPDRVYGQDEKVVETYNEKFRLIQEAYEVIRTSFRHAA